MKLLITSPDALIKAGTGTPFPGIVETLEGLLRDGLIEDVVTVSSRKGKLSGIPEFLGPLNVDSRQKRGTDFVQVLLEQLGKLYSDIIVLGANDSDLFMATNSKLLLLTARYSRENQPDSRVFKYGIGISRADRLRFVFEKFVNIKEPWYYTLEVDESTTMYALINANTLTGVGRDMKALIETFKRCLKEGDERYRSLFDIYCMAAVYAIREFREVKYWGVYPSSGVEPNEDLEYFKESARKLFKGKSTVPILMRTTPAAKRHTDKTKDQRIAEGCDGQFDSIIVNPYYEDKLPGETVCILDDFTTFGSSCETARVLLKKAGARRIIFAAMGKFGREYYRYNYVIDGDVFRDYGYRRDRTEPQRMNGAFNANANAEFLNSLRFLIE